MKLKTYEYGDGDKTALLIHGIMSSAASWVRVVPRLVDLGYRVITVDQRGHGANPHQDSYRPEELAEDMLDTLPTGAAVAIGHSLGGLVLGLTVAELRPKRAVYSDPAWPLSTNPALGEIRQFAAATKGVTREQIAEMNPRWAPEDLDTEIESFAAWDVRVVDGLIENVRDFTPPEAVVPSLVQLADPSMLITPDMFDGLRARGFEVRSVPGTGHCIHRDDLDGFFATLDGWI